jgi:hypothetical protein
LRHHEVGASEASVKSGCITEWNQFCSSSIG